MEKYQAKCKEYYEKAIIIDPKYALPWHGPAALCFSLGIMGFMHPKTAKELSQKAIYKALELDETLPEAHGHLGLLLASNYDWKRSENEFSKALNFDPKNWDIWHLYSLYYLLPMRQFDKALAAMRKASELDPLSSNVQAYIGYIYTAMRQYDQAIVQLKNALELEPHSFNANVGLGEAYIWKAEINKGIQISETTLRSLGQLPALKAYLGWAYSTAGRKNDAYRLLEELHKTAETSYVPATAFAPIYAGLGEIEESLNYLYKALDDQNFHISLSCFSIIQPPPLPPPLQSPPQKNELGGVAYFPPHFPFHLGSSWLDLDMLGLSRTQHGTQHGTQQGHFEGISGLSEKRLDLRKSLKDAALEVVPGAELNRRHTDFHSESEKSLFVVNTIFIN